MKSRRTFPGSISRSTSPTRTTPTPSTTRSCRSCAKSGASGWRSSPDWIPPSRTPSRWTRQPRMVEVEGLADVVAADSSICYIDGERGILSYRGIDIHELAEKSSFEEVCFLLWEGRLPRREELEETRRRIGPVSYTHL